MIPQEYQWVLGLLTPLPKMLLINLYLRICSKAYGSITRSVKITVVHCLQIQHALFLVIAMGYIATPATSYVILITDFILNFYEALKIIYKLKYSKKGYSVEEGRFISISNTKYNDHFYHNLNKSVSQKKVMYKYQV